MCVVSVEREKSWSKERTEVHSECEEERED